MSSNICSVCSSNMVKNGKTKAGTQRYRCLKCGSSQSRRYNLQARELKLFLDWLLGKQLQRNMRGQGRSFRRKTAKFWDIWPMSPLIDEVHRVIYIDGIYISRKTVVLIATTDEYVLSWHLAESENTVAYMALLRKIAPHDMVIADGGSGFQTALKKTWPTTLYQRCLFHMHTLVKRYLTAHPRLQASIELLKLTYELMYIENLEQAKLWVERLCQWSAFWQDFLNEKSFIDGKYQFTHIRIRKAYRAIFSAFRKGSLFAYLDPRLTRLGGLSKFNNRIEGGVNSPIRDMLRNHRGLSELRRIKAVFWWCYMHTETPLEPAEMLRSMPRNKDLQTLINAFRPKSRESIYPDTYGNAVVWSELHHSDSYPYTTE